MVEKCPKCESAAGIRETIYGMPAFEPDEAKYFVAGCTGSGQDVVCVRCGWGIVSDE